jgi:hypothetical protein
MLFNTRQNLIEVSLELSLFLKAYPSVVSLFSETPGTDTDAAECDCHSLPLTDEYATPGVPVCTVSVQIYPCSNIRSQPTAAHASLLSARGLR